MIMHIYYSISYNYRAYNYIIYNYAEYITMQLYTLDISLLTKLRSANDHIYDRTSMAQSSCSSYPHGQCLGQGSNPYTPIYRPNALTNRPPCHTIVYTQAYINARTFGHIRM